MGYTELAYVKSSPIVKPQLLIDREFVIKAGIMDYQSVKGNLGAQVWQKPVGDITHIWTLSWWDDFESIKAFGGEDMEKAKYYEQDKDYLLEFEPSVVHCESYGFG